MRRRWAFVQWVLLLLGGSVAQSQSISPPPSPPLVDELVERLIVRAREGLSDTNGLKHSWKRITLIEDFDKRGRVEKHRTKEHTVIGRGADQDATLVKIDDRPLSEQELTRERERESENRDRYAKRGDRRGNLELDEKLIRRFQYQWLSNEVVDGRWTHVLAFSPRPGQESGKAADRVLGNLGGRIWVDTELYEVSRIEAELLKKLSIGGFIAEVNRLGFLIERRPLPGGAWVNTRLDSHAAGRKLFDRFSSRMEVVQEDFQPLSVVPVGGAAEAASPATGQ